MNNDTTALQERIAEALAEHWRRKHSTLLTSGPCSGCSRVAADAVAAEVKSAKAEAILMDGFDMAVADRLADAGYTEYAEDEDGGVTWVSAPLGEVLHIVRICATEYETGDRA